MKATAIIMTAFAIFNQAAYADGLPPRSAYLPPPPQPSQSCLMTALQMGYLTGRREVAYANTEACIAFAGSRGVVLPYAAPRYYPPPGYYGQSRWTRRPLRRHPARAGHGSIGAADHVPQFHWPDHWHGEHRQQWAAHVP